MYGNYQGLVVRGLISVVVVTLGFSVHLEARHMNRQNDAWLEKWGGVTVDYVKGSHTSYSFDLCKVINCGRDPSSWTGYDVYLCGTAGRGFNLCS